MVPDSRAVLFVGRAGDNPIQGVALTSQQLSICGVYCKNVAITTSGSHCLAARLRESWVYAARHSLPAKDKMQWLGVAISPLEACSSSSAVFSGHSYDNLSCWDSSYSKGAHHAEAVCIIANHIAMLRERVLTLR